MKTCTKCKLEKSKVEFCKRTSNKDGLYSWCNECKAIEDKKYKDANKEKVKALCDAWRGRNSERSKKTRKNWYESNKNSPSFKAAVKKWREANQERIRAINRGWAERNSDKVKVNSNNQRARRSKQKSGMKLSKDIIPRLMELQKCRCPICKVSLKRVKTHLDHIMPLALGGLNVDSNVQLLCRECNLSKSAKHPIDFMQSKGLLL